MTLPKGKTTPTRRQNHERENENPDRGNEEADHRGRGRDEQHRPDSRAAKLAAEFFGTGRYENTAQPQRVQHLERVGRASGREWKFQKDVTIAGPDSEKCELVTPILTYADMETLQELIRRLRRAGAKSDCHQGLRRSHPHRSQGPHARRRLRNLANIMASHEEPSGRSALNLDRLPHQPLLPHG